MNVEDIIKNNKIWASEKLKEDKDFFNTLSKGQDPSVLYIGCSDSRVTAEEMMGIKAGEAFVHRNIANMVISIDLNCMSVVNYAVDHLKVDHIIICGHYGCGGIKSAMESEDLGILNPWLRNIRNVHRLHKDELNLITDEKKRYDRLVELNVQEQCINVIQTAAVQRSSKERGLKVYGWVFNIHDGEIIDLKIDFDSILSDIEEIYRLDI